jgi:hypothetical protein
MLNVNGCVRGSALNFGVGGLAGKIRDPLLGLQNRRGFTFTIS